jgi:hyperosmotically inducible periplasmic protein
MRSFERRSVKWLLCASLAFPAIMFMNPMTSLSQEQSNSQTTSSDNSAKNQGHTNTADQQSENSSDRMTTKKIRQAVMADKSLSTYAHNVKIITQNGVVTLKGPVNSDEEKQSIASKAEEIVGSADKVNDRLTVKK